MRTHWNCLECGSENTVKEGGLNDCGHVIQKYFFCNDCKATTIVEFGPGVAVNSYKEDAR